MEGGRRRWHRGVAGWAGVGDAPRVHPRPRRGRPAHRLCARPGAEPAPVAPASRGRLGRHDLRAACRAVSSKKHRGSCSAQKRCLMGSIWPHTVGPSPGVPTTLFMWGRTAPSGRLRLRLSLLVLAGAVSSARQPPLGYWTASAWPTCSRRPKLRAGRSPARISASMTFLAPTGSGCLPACGLAGCIPSTGKACRLSHVHDELAALAAS